MHLMLRISIKKVFVVAVAVIVVILLAARFYDRFWIQPRLNNKTNTQSTMLLSQASKRLEKVPLKMHNPLPTGVCSTYSELRDVNFLHHSMRDSLCEGVPAYSIVDSSFPLCELSQKLPELVIAAVNASSFQSYIQNPETNRNVSCFVYKSSDYISDIIRHTHIFEEGNVRSLMKLIRKFNSVKSPVTFVDIGSNIGVFTLSALDLGVPVVALDANIRNLVRIKLSAESQKLSHKLRLLWNFISSQVSLMYLNFPGNCNIGGATKFGRAVTDTIPVMSTTGDSIASAIKTRMVVMKVDIEGGEGAFFKSATTLFDTFTIPVVHMEWLERHMSDEERKFMIQFFTSRRYVPRSLYDVNRRINVDDPKLSCEDLLWIREDYTKI